MPQDIDSPVRKFSPRLEEQVRPGERVPTLFWSTDIELRVTSVQGTGLALLHLQPDALNGVSLSDYFKRQGPDHSFIEAHQRALQGESSSLEVAWGGQTFDAQVEPLYGPDGTIGGTIGVARELTGRKRAESARAEKALRRAEEKYRSIVENAVEGIFQTTPEGGYLSVNPALARMYGYSSPGELMASVSDIGYQVYVDPSRRAEFKCLMEEHGVVRDFQYEVYRRDRKKIWLSESARAVRDDSGTILYYEGTVEDITERKRAETERQAMFEIIHGVNVTANLDELLRLIHQALKKVLYAENCFVALYDRSTGMFHFPFFVDQFDSAPPPVKMGKSCTAHVFCTGRPMLITHSTFNQLAAQGEVELVGTPSPAWLGVPLRTPSKTMGVLVVQHYENEGAYTERDLEFLASVGGQIALAIERKQAEQALRASENHLRAIVEAEPECVQLIACDGTVLDMNPAGVAMVEAETAAQLLGHSVYSLICPEYREEFRKFTESVCRGHRGRTEFEITGLKGTRRWMETYAVPLPTESNASPVLLGVTRDVTERKRAEEALRESEASFRLLFEHNPLPTWVYDLESLQFLQVNAAAVKHYGYSREEFLRMRITDIRPPEDVPRLLQMVRHDRPALLARSQWRHRCKEGRIADVEVISHRLELGGREVVLVVAQDVTERQRAEKALRRSEANYRSLVQGAPYGIYRVSTHGKLLDVNPALAEMLGYSSEAELMAINLDANVYRDPDERARILQRRPERFEGAEVVWKRKGGTFLTVRLSGRLVHDPGGATDYYEMIAENVTERRALEHQLRQAQKMEAVGRLAGGVAHDFNNLLMVIKGHSELLLDRTRGDEGLYRKADQIHKAADRAAALTQQLLAFSRMQVLQPKLIDLNVATAEMGKMLPRLIREDIELSIFVDPRPCRVKADPVQIEQVILNLAVNARDAMPNGGKLIIETKNCELDEAYARRHPPMLPGRFAMLAVSDTGTGMDAKTQTHIFEPFFTTKEKGKGTGLGLATVYGVVKQSGGFIWVYSEPGQGTTFKIYLPRVDEPVEARLEKASAEAPRGCETILLVEDERDVREVAREFLGLSGYTVLEAKDGAEAIETAMRHPGTIHLLVTDMVMPGMGGRELAAHLAPLRPEMKVVYMSGYTEYSSVHQGDLDENAVLLTKPFTRSILTRTVREALRAEERTDAGPARDTGGRG